MTSSINRWSPHGLKAILTVLDTPAAADFEDGTLKAMILGDTNDLSDESVWNSVAVLDQGGFTLDEYEYSSTVRRETVTINAISLSSAEVQVSFDPIVWTSLLGPPDSGNEPRHVLVYMEKDGATADATGVLDLRVPVAIFDAEFTTDGTTFTALPPSGGAVYIST